MCNARRLRIATLLGLAAMQAMGCRDSTSPTPTPIPGTISVVVSTQGATIDFDPDGYVVNVDGFPGPTVGHNATITLADVPAGRHVVLLEGLSSNCSVGSNPRSVDVVANSSVSVAFRVACAPAPRRGTLQVSTTTSGVDIDVDGYWLSLRDEVSNIWGGERVPTNGSVKIPLQPGSYLLSLHGVAANCDVVLPSPHTVVVALDSTTTASLSVRCETPGRLAFVRGVGAATDIHVVNSSGTGAAQLTHNRAADLDPAWSPDGSKLAFASDRDGNLEIYLMNADGTNPIRLTSAPGSDARPSWSPDGARIAFVSNRDGVPDIYVMNADGTNTVRITNDASNADPAWSPDGDRIAFQSERGGTTAIWSMNADGSGLARVTTGQRGDRHPAWSPDGTRLAFSRGTPDSAQDIYYVNADGSGLTQVTKGRSMAADPGWSPNGRQIAFTGEGYYTPSEIVIVRTDSERYTSVTALSPTSNPAWRP